MSLSAVVLMMNHAGCVCQDPVKAPDVATSGSATLAGNATIAAVQAAAAAATASQQQQQQQQRRY